MAETTMARPKRAPKAKPDPKGASESGFKTIGVRSSPEWAEWIEGVAKHYRTTIAGIIDRAMSEWTEENGYPERPPERLP
jgi:hypothetical protein